MYNDMMGPPYVFPGILGETSRGILELLVYPEPRWPYERGHLGIGDGAESRVGLVFTFGWQQRDDNPSFQVSRFLTGSS